MFGPEVCARTTRQGFAIAAASALHPDQMSAADRLDEVAEILAAGLVRLRARQSSRVSRDSGESSLHFMPAESGRGTGRERAGRAT